MKLFVIRQIDRLEEVINYCSLNDIVVYTKDISNGTEYVIDYCYEEKLTPLIEERLIQLIELDLDNVTEDQNGQV